MLLTGNSGHLARFSRDVGYHCARLTFFRHEQKKVEVRGIPHLAKNERDMGHPAFVTRRILEESFYSAFKVIDGSTWAARHAGTQHAIADTPVSRAITRR